MLKKNPYERRGKQSKVDKRVDGGNKIWIRLKTPRGKKRNKT